MKQSAGIIIVDESGPEKTVLCLRAYANWDFPKGELEEGEAAISAAIRETVEETTLLHGADYILVGETAPPITYGSGKAKKTATYFVAKRMSTKDPFLPVSPELGKPENDEWKWVPMTEISFLLASRFGPIINFLHKS